MPALRTVRQGVPAHRAARVDVPRVSVVVPARNEEDRLRETLRAAREGARGPIELIVVDGQSADATARIAEDEGAHILSSAPGRGRQMNAGAVLARGEILLFLHADTRLPADWDERAAQILARPGVAGGAFRVRLDAPGLGFRLIERGINARARLFSLPYGDQALFLKRERFVQLGGFPEWPAMEDFAFVRRLKRAGRVTIARETAATSARAWRRRGLLRFTLLNQLSIAAYFLGVSPERIASWREGPRP